MANLPDPLSTRSADHPIETLFLNRVSWRAITSDVSETEVHSLLEAARWAPSTYNEQEWRFLYALTGDDHWDTLADLLVEGNAWAKAAGCLIVVCSHTTFSRNGKSNPVHEYDAGAAAMALCLQATAMGLVAHQMAGFDHGRVPTALGLPDDVRPHAMIAVGRPGDPDSLAPPLRGMEQATGRKPISEISSRGMWSF